MQIHYGRQQRLNSCLIWQKYKEHTLALILPSTFYQIYTEHLLKHNTLNS